MNDGSVIFFSPRVSEPDDFQVSLTLNATKKVRVKDANFSGEVDSFPDADVQAVMSFTSAGAMCVSRLSLVQNSSLR